MKSFTLWIFVLLAGLCLGCNDTPDLTLCPGGACETQDQCKIECEDVCGDPDFLSFQCVEGTCECQCFYGCR